MQKNFSVWFHDYDAKPSLLYRSAMRLRQESWQFVDDINSARWWVLAQPSEETERKIKTLYQQQKHRPVVVVLNEGDSSEYHNSWAILRMPINYVTFFKWIDEVIDSIDTGELDANANTLYQVPVVDEEVFHNEQWAKGEFKLSKWPNVARFDNGIEVVELCALLLQSFQSLASLKSRGFDAQLVYDLLSVCDTRGILTYSDAQAEVVSVNADLVAPDLVADVYSDISVTAMTPVEATPKDQPIASSAGIDAVAKDSAQVVLPEADDNESRVASVNKPSLLDAILKTLKFR